MANIIREVAETFSTLAQGFSVTFRNMFRKTVTENYPYEPVHFQPRYRGIHVLHRDESGFAAPRREWFGEVRGLLPVRGGLPGKLHLHRSRGEH